MAKGFTIKVTPDPQKVRIDLLNFNTKELEDIHFRLVQGANKIRSHMIRGMQNTPKSGLKYRRGGKWHIASSPGNPPAIDSGELIRSLVMDKGLDFVEVGSKSGAPHAVFLEGGTGITSSRSGGTAANILARPFMAPAANDILPTIQKNIRDDLEGKLK